MKAIQHLSDLAIAGAPPLFDEPLHVGRPNVANQEQFLRRVEEMFQRRWFTNNGPFVQEFERKIAEYIGVKHCIAICNATIGLELAIRAAGLTGEVIVPSYTFVATAHALQWQEITPVFADIDPETHTLDPAEVERHITPRTTGIIATHLWGRPCNISALEKIAFRHNLKLLFDAAHAFGCSANGKMIGGFGLAEVFSFHATKFLNSFEGGAITTNDDELANRIRLMKNFGFKGYDNVVHIGTNGKMTEICAAMGIINLEKIDALIAVNHRNYLAYQNSLGGIPGITLLSDSTLERRNYQYIVILVDEERSGLSRDELVAILHKDNILARRYFWPGCHRMQPYRSLFPDSYLDLPETEHIAAAVIVLPTGTSVGLHEIGAACAVLRVAVANAILAREALATHPNSGSVPCVLRPTPIEKD